MIDELPLGWAVTTLGAVGRWGSGGTPKTSDRSYYGGAIPWAKSGDLNDGQLFETEDKITEAGLANSAAKLLEPGTLLIALYGATIGRVAVNQISCATNQAVAHCAPHADLTSTDYLFWFTLASRAELRELGQGGAQPNISQAILKAFPIPLPPLPEQRRIVARIEALFARTRRARADLERIAPLAKRYREQSRRKAFMPDVAPTTGERRIELPEYTPADRFEELPDLPSGWQWAEMGAIGAIAGGLTKNQQRAGLPFEMPYLRVANVYADELRLDAIETLRVTAAEKARVLLQAGDLLIVEGNGSLEQIGRVAVWDGSVPGCGHQNHLIRLRPKHGLPSRFLMHWLMSPFGRGVLEQIASSSSGLHTLSLSKVSRIPVPIPGIASASAIADQLDQMMASSDRAAKDAARALALLDRLEQSILARAFRGELVPQDPDDEPISVELERLRPAPATAGRGRSRQRKKPETEKSVTPRMKGPAVPKNRADADVKGQPYLANHLRQIGSAATAEDLYKAADLSIADFYKQLSEEVARGWVKDASGKLEAA